MLAKFVGGPYDGIELDHNDINLYTHFQPVGLRKFALMPPFDHWEAIRRGDEDKDGNFGMRLVYELVRTNGRNFQAVFDPTGKVFANALRDENEGRRPQPVPRPFTGAYYQCIRGEWALSSEGHFAVTDEKGRTWACSKVPREEAERPNAFAGTGGMMQAYEASGTNERFSVSTVHCESRDELPGKLADIID